MAVPVINLTKSVPGAGKTGSGMNIPHRAAFVAFLILNALKLTLFDLFLLQKPSVGIFEYKFLMTILVVLIIYPLVYRLGSRIAMICLYLLQALYIVINLGYFIYFRSYLHLPQYFYLFREGFSVAGNSAVPLSLKMLLVLIDLPFFIMIATVKRGRRKRGFKLGRFVKTAMSLSFITIVAIESFNYYQKDSIVNMIDDTFSGESPIVERYGTIADNVVNYVHNGSNKALTGQLKYGSEQTGEATAGARPNYILIQVESMDANIVNETYKDSYVTPFLHSLESSSIYYPYTMSYHEGGGTSDSEFSVLNSVEPLQSYPALKLSSYDYPNSMVSQLKKASYDTLAFHGNVGSFYNRDIAFPKIGYSEFYDMLKMGLPENGWGLPDDEVFSYALDKLEALKGPFFTQLITMTSHEPFNSARHYYNNSLYDDIGDTTVKDYFNSMSYVDKSIQDFVQKVETDFKDTYVIIYGDHTPNINDPMYKQASFTLDGRYFEFVPMFVITPDGKSHIETKEAASFLDVAPTVLKTSGIGFAIRSDGLDLTGPALEPQSLPFKGGSYDRAVLFTNASATAQSSRPA